MDEHASVLVIAAPHDMAGGSRVWGTGGWLPPESREALDWLTLARLLGWGVTVAPANGHVGLEDRRWIVVGCDPRSLDEETVARLKAAVTNLPVALVLRASDPGTAVARLAGAASGPRQVAGAHLEWRGPGGAWSRRCRRAVDACALAVSPGTDVWACLDRAAVVAARPIGRGVVVTLGFHPSAARDADGSMTALLRRVLVSAARRPVAWLDLDGVMVLRMDDPGGAQNVHSRTWHHQKLDEDAWATIGRGLARRDGRMSIGYVPGWMDDGAPGRGVLTVDGQAVTRVAGSIHPSPQVRYEDRAGHAPGTVHDYRREYRGIQRLRAAGLAEVELHGYTHMHPDRGAWASAPDRYESTSWYREFGRRAEALIAAMAPGERPIARGLATLERFFGTRPTTLICPGDEWTDAALARALDVGLELVSSYYLALRHEGRFCWAQHVCAPYLDEPESRWFDSGLPVVGYFHDRDVALCGPDWVDACLGRWQEAGARRFIDLRELAAAVSRQVRLAVADRRLRLEVAGGRGVPLVRGLRVGIALPDDVGPTAIEAEVGGIVEGVPIESLRDDWGRATVLAPALAGEG